MSRSNAKKVLKNIPYGRQLIDQADIRAVVRTLQSDWLTQGPAVDAFEKALCKVTGAKYAVAVANGTAALHVAYLAAGITKGDQVITPALTFAATANAALYCGAKPVFADIESHTGNIDARLIEPLINKSTKMIVAVHYAGYPCDMKALKRIAVKHRLLLVEDAAHALGAVDDGQKIGACTHSDMATFSFHPLKHITTAEGGAVLTNNKILYERLLMLRTHGITKDHSRLTDRTQGGWYHEMQLLGFNYRLSDIQCALGLSQLGKLPRFIAARRKIAKRYDKAFKNNPHIEILQEDRNRTCSYHLYPIRLKGGAQGYRAEIFDDLRKASIGVQVHYIPVYWHPYYQQLGYRKGINPNAERFYLSQISLPVYPGLTQKDCDRVIKTVLNILDRF